MLEQRKQEMCRHENYWLNFVPEKYNPQKLSVNCYCTLNENLFHMWNQVSIMANFEKIYKRVALQIIKRCHGAIKITKHGKIIEVYDLKRHIWSDGLAGLIIKEECKTADLKEWEFANVRSYVIKELLAKSKDQ